MPVQMTEIATRYQNFWQHQPLSGLTEAEQIELFAKLGLNMQPESSDRPYLLRIGRAYEGHPLALRVIGRNRESAVLWAGESVLAQVRSGN